MQISTSWNFIFPSPTCYISDRGFFFFFVCIKCFSLIRIALSENFLFLWNKNVILSTPQTWLIINNVGTKYPSYFLSVLPHKSVTNFVISYFLSPHPHTLSLTHKRTSLAFFFFIILSRNYRICLYFSFVSSECSMFYAPTVNDKIHVIAFHDFMLPYGHLTVFLNNLFFIHTILLYYTSKTSELFLRLF